MTLNRREFLRLAGIIATGATLSACEPVYRKIAGPIEELVPQPFVPDGVFRALNRLTFGPRIFERVQVSEIGLKAWIEEQLAPERIEDSSAQIRVRHLDALQLDADALEGWEREEVIAALQQGTLIRQVYSRRQLYERMVAFWTDHFNISVDKGDCWFLKVVDDREVIRPHAMGNFRDLLWASAKSPAMLIYLDNQANESRAPNENYARELMELHTLGVDGGYTQSDVQELARCLTGWTVKDKFWLGEYAFEQNLHDSGVKRVLGQKIEPKGEREAERVLDILAAHPSTARFVSRKLVRSFVMDPPPEHLVERAAETFLATDGDIKAVMGAILLDGLVPMHNELPRRFKRPVSFVTSALRILNVDTDCGNPFQTHLSMMGQPPFRWPTPDGPPDDSESWQGNLLPRWNFSLQLARNEIDDATHLEIEKILEITGARDIETFINLASPLLLGKQISTATGNRLASALRDAGAKDDPETAAVILAGLLASPAFQVI